MSGVVTLHHLPEAAGADHVLSCEELIAELLVILDDIPERSLGICGRLARARPGYSSRGASHTSGVRCGPRHRSFASLPPSIFAIAVTTSFFIFDAVIT